MLADAGGIKEAAAVLAAGGLAAFPTETVYGLGADATNANAVAKLYAAKGRPSFNPLIAHVANVTAAKRAGHFNAMAMQLAAKFWPGPLTLVVPASDLVCGLARAGLDTVGLRVPSHPAAQKMLSAFGKPVVAPSANRSGHVSPTSAEHVLADLAGKIDFVLDGGATPLGLESTIVDCSSDVPRLLRAGGLPREEIENALGQKIEAAAADENAPASPGQLASHYATRASLRLDAREVKQGEALLAFGERLPMGAENAVLTLNLSRHGDLVEAAVNLFAYMRALDEAGVSRIAVVPIPRIGLGEAINDRLARAAAPRT
ncbi:MAG TPA: L-threonylcarbamoyladenylate synthase [Xanthobacteraceae bacterium]|nr:L-threonylcarbamoyladenylate synthase [Xanthobacteraceae bacterium]